MGKKRITVFIITVFFLISTVANLTALPKRERVVPAAERYPRSKQLVVYTYDAFPRALQLSVEEHFKDEHDVKVNFQRFEDTGGLLNQLLIEIADPLADVMIGLDTTYLQRIYEEELLLAYRPEGFTASSPSLIVDEEFRAVPFDYGSVTLNYDSRRLDVPPNTWEDLLDPRLKRSIILMNPSTSSPGRNFLLFTIAEFGEKKYLEFWEKLKPNILTITAGWSEGYGLYTEGEAPIVLSYDTSPTYHIMYENEDRYKNVFLGGKAYAQIEVAGIIRGAVNPEYGRRFMDFIVSEEFQSLIPENQIMYPIHPGIQLPEAFEKTEKPSQLVLLNEETVATRINDWLEAWEETMR